MTTERPILFSAPMVRAILAGTKTQTRRVMKMTDRARQSIGDRWPVEAAPGYFRWEGLPASPPFDAENFNAWCPYGAPGDHLWVRETVGALPEYPDALTMPEYEGGHNPSRLIYRADEIRGLVTHYGIDFSRIRWRPSLHMPRWASRITLEVTGVRVERLQAITEEDARAEGVLNYGERLVVEHDDPLLSWGRDRFRALWDTINGKRAPWNTNPWVWCVSFRRALAEGKGEG